MLRKIIFPFILVLGVSPFLQAAEKTGRGYSRTVKVSAPTRLDWVFPLANRSVTTPPKEWLKGYKSTDQTYERYVPANYTSRKAWPVILFISPGDSAMGWRYLKEACTKRGFIFAGPHAAGNRCPMPQRIRRVMDVLDDLRRNYNIDPDRVYIGGFSGGGRVACSIAFALPELFGGVIPICAAGDLRKESWLRQRVMDRISVAHITGTADFNRGEVERFRGPMLAEVGVRSKIWVIPRMGHGVPSGKNWIPILKWLDDGVTRRKLFAKKFPASRIENSESPDAEAWSKRLLKEAKSRLKKPKTLYSGLRQLVGIRTRWPETSAARESLELLRTYESRKVRPWDKDDIAEQRKFLIARANALDAYATGPLPKQYTASRRNMLQAVLELWSQVEQDGQDPVATKKAKLRIPILKQSLEKIGDK